MTATQDNARQPSGGRLVALDSIRGIAAMTVMISHYWNILGLELKTSFASYYRLVETLQPVLPIPGRLLELSATPLGLLQSARPAVMIFFVLSGYVLSLGFLAGAKVSYPVFVVRRFIRIWVPFAAAILMSAVLYTLFWTPSLSGYGPWAAENWADAPSFDVLMRHLLMVGIGDSARSLNDPMWSLVHELRISFVFPLLFLLCRGPSVLVLLAAALLQIVVDLSLRGTGVLPRPTFGEDALQSVLITLHCVLPFVFGILLARHAAAVRKGLRRTPPLTPGWLWQACLWLVASALLMRWNDWLSSIGAALVIALSLNSATALRILSGRVVTWLGKVSYSLYLVHFPVILAMAHGLHGLLPPGVVALASIGVALLVAEMGYRLVEHPSILLARRLSRHMQQRAATPAPSGST